MARLGPSGLAQLFREIANYVSTRLSNYNTKAELDSLLDAKADDNNVIHTNGDETIDGTKTFTSGPWVTNNQTTMGFSIKNTALARNDIPSQLYHATFRAYDKNAKILGEYCVEKSTSGDSLLNMGVRSEDDSGTQIAYGLQFRMTNDGSLVRFLPSANNKVHLGDPGAKWLKVHSDDVVHTSGNETINGSKTFTNQLFLGAGGTGYGLISAKDNNSILRLFGGTSPSTGANLDLYGEGLNDGGFSLRARTSDKIVSLDAKVDGTLKWNGKNVALDENLVHTSGDEHINGTKMFSNTIHRYADLTASGGEQVYRFDDINANGCGHIYNNVHWTGDAVYNRYGAYNNKSGKSMEIDIISPDSGVGMAYVSGTATKGNVEAVTSATGHTGIATMGWVNNPATSTNVVHRSGDETIAGTKTFSNRIISNKDLHYKDTTYNWADTSLNVWCDAGHVAWYDKTGNRRMHELVGAQSGVWRKACYINENQYFSVDSNRNISYWGTATFNGHTIFTQDMIFKNNNIDLTVTPANILYSNFIFTDKNHQNLAYLQYAKRNTDPDILGLYINDKDKNLHGIQITSNNYLLPMGNNIWNLGSPNNRWAQFYVSRINCDNIIRTDENSYIYMTAGPSYNNGASIFLNGKSGDGLGTGKGTFLLFARDGTNERRLLGYPNGLLSWNGCIESHEFRSTNGNAFMAQNGGYTFLIRNDGSNTYFLMSDKDGVPGTWSSARPLTINDATGVCNINGNANSATKASYLDNYSNVGGNKIYLDWDRQVKGYVGLKVDNTTMGGLVTTTNLSSQTNTLCSTFANGIRFGGVGCIKLLAFEWDGYNTYAYSLQEGTTYAGANLRHVVMSLSGTSTIPSGSDTIGKGLSQIYLGTRPTGTWSLLGAFGAVNRSYHPNTCVGLFVRIA